MVKGSSASKNQKNRLKTREKEEGQKVKENPLILLFNRFLSVKKAFKAAVAHYRELTSTQFTIIL